MRSAVTSWRWVVSLLVVIAGGMSWMTYQIPPGFGKLPGAFLLVMGALTISLHRRIGQQMFGRALSMHPLVARFWGYGGEKGAQVLYLGIGIILAAAGCVLVCRW